MSKIANAKEKKESLQALRAIAFIVIFLTHAGIRVHTTYLGVAVFFCLSGFLLIYNGYEKEYEAGFINNIKFSFDRIKKLYPLHIVTMLLVLAIPLSKLLIKGNAGMPVSDLLLAIGLNITLLQTWYPSLEMNMALNGVAWFLSVSVFLYFCFPWLVNLMKKIKKEAVLYIVSLSILVVQLIFSMIVIILCKEAGATWIWATYFFPLFRLGDLVIGANLGLIFKRHLDNKNIGVAKATLLEIAAIVIIIIFEVFRANLKTDNAFLLSLTNPTSAYIVLAGMLVILFSMKKGIITKLVTNPALVWLGNISAITYLIHYMVILYFGNLFNFFDVTLNKGLSILVVAAEFIITILLSLLWSHSFGKRH